MIEITGVDLVALAKKAYELSAPQGMGFLHARDGELDEDTAARLVSDDPHFPLSMDYVHGRACKLTVFKEGDRMFISNQWHDHSEDQLKQLLEAVGIKHTFA